MALLQSDVFYVEKIVSLDEVDEELLFYLRASFRIPCARNIIGADGAGYEACQ